MQYDVETPQAYLDALEDDWRKALVQRLRGIIRAVAPDWDEGIGHKMLRYTGRNGPALHLNAQKGYVGLYVGDVAVLDSSGDLLAGIDCGKCCIRLRKVKTLDEAALRMLIARVHARPEAGERTDC